MNRNWTIHETFERLFLKTFVKDVVPQELKEEYLTDSFDFDFIAGYRK